MIKCAIVQYKNVKQIFTFPPALPHPLGRSRIFSAKDLTWETVRSLINDPLRVKVLKSVRVNVRICIGIRVSVKVSKRSDLRKCLFTH